MKQPEIPANESDRKASELQLGEVLNLNQAILDSANFAIISTDLQGTIQSFNAAAERLLGYAASEVIGKTSPAIFHDLDEIVSQSKHLSQELERDIEVGFEVFVAKAKLGQVYEQEWTYIRKDGSRFPVMLSISALRNNDNQISGFLGIACDISMRKQAEDKLQDTLRELAFQKFALDQSAIVAVTDLDGKITYANNKFIT